MAKELTLSNSIVRAIVDDEDFEKVNRYTWHAQPDGYVVTKLNRNQKLIPLHRFILDAAKFQQIDHINRIKHDCRKANLRFCTQSQNNINTPKKNGTFLSKYKGVSFHKHNNKWQAQIKKNGKGFYGGLFNTEREAALKANELYLEHFGEFALLNSVV